MANLVFPQLSSGAFVQFPIRKQRYARTIRNLLPDGTLICTPDLTAGLLRWELQYTALAAGDLNALSVHFAACQGRLHGFTFLDPTDNLLTNSANLQAASWQAGTGISVVPGNTDPVGGDAAFTVTNAGQTLVAIMQTVSAPANLQYCFSIYAASAYPSNIQMLRQGSVARDQTVVDVSAQWSRLVSSGQLQDAAESFTIGVAIQPGQQISLYGPQLEAQISPSTYRPTLESSGLYLNSHWGVDELAVSADGPDLFSTAFIIETAI